MSQRGENSKRLRLRRAKLKPATKSSTSQVSIRSSHIPRLNSPIPPRREKSRSRKAASSAAHAVADLLAHTQEIANVGSWEYDPENKTFLWSDHMYRMLGLKPDTEPVPLENACRLFHPDDRARVWSDVRALIETGTRLENEVRFTSAHG
jgi:PAS domain-containing protein